MTRIWSAIEHHALLLAALAIVWLLVVGYISAFGFPAGGGLTSEAILLAFAMCGFAGAVATAIAPAELKLRAAALGGALIIASYFVAMFAAQLVHGESVGIEVSSNPAEGGLAEAAVWVVGTFLIGGTVGVVGGGIAAAVTRTGIADAEVRGALLLVLAMVGLLALLLALPGLLGYQ